MTSAPLTRLLSLRPFQPFVIHLADQRQFAVRHPDAATLSDGGRTVVVLNREGMDEIVDTLLIASLRPLSQRAPETP